MEITDDYFYSKPFQPIKEVIFCNFPDFFANFPKETQGKGTKTDDPRGQIGQSVSHGEEQGREQQKIGGAAQEKEEDGVAPYHALVCRHRVKEQGGGDAQPEQQVQDRPKQL